MKKAPLNKVSKLFSRKTFLNSFEEILYSSFDRSECHFFPNGISNVCFNRQKKGKTCLMVEFGLFYIINFQVCHLSKS